MQLDELNRAVGQDAAFRRRRRLQPVGGQGDKIFPPTYPGEEKNDPPQHVFEVRRIAGEDIVCVLIDSVQSQANRLEEALLEAARAGAIELPRVVVEFAKTDLEGVPDISSLDAPHRIFDAILRDSLVAEGSGMKPFRESEVGSRVRRAKSFDATAILEISPTSLLFGVWNSTGEGGGLGAKFARAIVSEIVGIGVPVEEATDRRTGEVTLRTAGRRTGSRIDPLGVLRKVEVYKGDGGWDVTQKGAGAKAKQVRPSEINHGNIAPSVDKLGVTCDYAEQTCVITLAGLRRLRFGGDGAREVAGRAYLAALGLLALAEADAQGYALRSRCDLVCDGSAALELVAADGRSTMVDLSLETTRALYREATAAARAAGFALSATPLALTPSDKLVHIVRESQRQALADEGGEADEG